MDNQNLSRYDFLKAMGFRGAALMAILTSCVNEDDMFVQATTVNDNGAAVTPNTPTTTPTTTPTNTNTNTNTTPSTSTLKGTSKTVTTAELDAIKSPLVKLDLASTTAKNLQTVGGYIINNNVVLAQVSAGSYAAVQNLCTHEPKKRIIWNKTEWYCTDHGAKFEAVTAAPTNKIAPKAIVVYKVATDGKSIVVYA